MTQVNRYLKNKLMDQIYHALGRPVYPMRETYRNNYGADELEARVFDNSPHWEFVIRHSGLKFYRVTKYGRISLDNYLENIGDQVPPHGTLLP